MFEQNTDGMLPDEACHMQSRIYSMSELLNEDHSGSVMLHNTMRFDVQMSYVQPLIDSGEVDVSEMAAEIRESIKRIIDRFVGAGLDGCPVEIHVYPVKKTKMLHRETISCCLD